MKSILDKWIIDSREDIPDPGEYRRLNRALVKEQMAIAGTRRMRNRVLLAALSLAFIMMYSGQLKQLGSDDFETISSSDVLPLNGDTVTIHEAPFRGTQVYLPEDFSETDVDEYFQGAAAREGEMIRVTGLSYEGKTDWTKIVRMVVNGQELVVNSPTPIQDPKPETPRDFEKFLLAHIMDLTARAKSEPPHARMQKAIDGVLVDFKIWEFEYPGYGKVIWYDGVPAGIE